MAVDLKPVFDGEREILQRHSGIELPAHHRYYRSFNRIIASSETLFRFKVLLDGSEGGGSIHSLATTPSSDVIAEKLSSVESRMSKRQHSDGLKTLMEANREHMEKKIDEAIAFIRETAERYEDLPKYISFSGGKDSVVVAMLVKIALRSMDIPLFFADTTLEAVPTHEFVENFSSEYGFTLLDSSMYKSPKDFFDLCHSLGPPSIFYRWCCTVFKSYPVNLLYGDHKGDILTFDGIRRRESLRRKKYDRISRIKKIPKQIAAYPIIDWREFDVWLFILTGGLGRLSGPISFNPLYCEGQTRVGCVVCPAASPTNCYFRRIRPDPLWTRFEKLLYAYARTVGRDRSWVDGDYWRLRRPRQDVLVAGQSLSGTTTDHSGVLESSSLCGNDGMYTYSLGRRPSQEAAAQMFVDEDDLRHCSTLRISNQLIEFLKPFGSVRTVKLGRKQYFRVMGQDGEALASGLIGGASIVVHTGNDGGLPTKREFDTQLTKAINCVGCGGCIGFCKGGHISITDGLFHIADDGCIHCRECISHKGVSGKCIALSYGLKKMVIENVSDTGEK